MDAEKDGSHFDSLSAKRALFSKRPNDWIAIVEQLELVVLLDRNLYIEALFVFMKEILKLKYLVISS